MLEAKILRLSGIPLEAYTIRNVRLDQEKDSENYIHEIRIDGLSKGLPTMVMIHGYGAGGLQFFKNLRPLREYFNIIMIDLLGMGNSGRPQNVQLDNDDQIIDFFVNSINRWSKVANVGQDG